jgi:hypothetical protein
LAKKAAGATRMFIIPAVTLMISASAFAQTIRRKVTIMHRARPSY